MKRKVSCSVVLAAIISRELKMQRAVTAGDVLDDGQSGGACDVTHAHAPLNAGVAGPRSVAGLPVS